MAILVEKGSSQSLNQGRGWHLCYGEGETEAAALESNVIDNGWSFKFEDIFTRLEMATTL